MHVAAAPRHPVTVLRAVVRNALDAVPPEAFHAPLVTARLNGRQRIYVCDPALIREAFIAHAASLDKGADIRRVLCPALGEGLLTANGPHWRWQRAAAAPVFRHERLQGFLPAMIAQAETTAVRWAAGPAELDVAHEMMRTTYGIIVDTMLSGPGRMDVDRVERGITAYLRPSGWMFALSLLDAPAWMPFPGRRRAMAAARHMRRAVAATVAERRAAVPRGDLVDMLLAAADPDTGRQLTDAEIADNLLTFVTAGHETTALGLAWCLHLLARHPGHEARVRAEIDAVTGSGPVRPEHVAHLHETRAAFHEALRLYPSAPIIARVATAPFRLGTLDVPAGAYVYVPIHAVHRHRALWTDPDRFDPARFAPDAERARDRYSFMPFGAGPRVCIGAAFATLEAVTILAVLLRAGRLMALEDPPPPVMRLTLRPARPLRIRWTPTAPASTRTAPSARRPALPA